MLDDSKRTELLLANEKNVILNYNVTNKESSKMTRFKKIKELGQIIQFLRVSGGIYILTEDDLRFFGEGKGVDLE